MASCARCGVSIDDRPPWSKFCKPCAAIELAERKRFHARHSKKSHATRSAIAKEREALRAAVREALCVPTAPSQPTNALAGSKAKVEVLAARREARLELWADGDPTVSDLPD